MIKQHEQSAHSMQPEERKARRGYWQGLPGGLRGQFAGGVPKPGRWQRELPLRLEVGTAWEKGGNRREHPNGDSLVALQGTCIWNEQLLPFGLFVIADGMGEQAHHREAGTLALETLVHFVLLGLTSRKQLAEEHLPKLLVEGVRRANLAVYQRSIETCAYMVATMTAALVIELTAYVVNVGAGRAYRYRESEGLVQITRDHSLAARMLETGVLTAEEAQGHPERRRIYRGLGHKASVDIDCFKLALQVDDRLLLCSDGLWEVVHDPQLMEILKQPGSRPEELSQQLVQTALEGGGQDNISAIVVQVAPITA